MFQIQGKVALLIGAARGVGLELVRHLLQQQVKAVAIAEINNEVGKIAVQKLQEEFGLQRVVLLQANIFQSRELESVFIETIKQLNQLDIVINNLGVFDENEIDKSQTINIVTIMRSTLLAVKTYLPQSKLGSEAVVVNVNAAVTLGDWTTRTPMGGSLPGFSTQVQQEANNIKIISLYVASTATELVTELTTNQLIQNITKVPEFKTLQGWQTVARALIRTIQQGVTGTVPVQQQFSVVDQLQTKLNLNEIVL